ncbi:GntR family transcriptional regulator [Bacillus sp. JJ1764]|uniref:GntR family transcriptional regulator n=1 Tax=Bacillus sp. JJ1764 TaxID=3122964 RepID=UPI0030006FC8
MGRRINLVSNHVKEIVEEYIAVHHLSPHDKLPSERSMCDMWKVNRVTLRGALSYLVDEGVLYLIPNNGYYMAPPKLVRNIEDLSLVKTDAENKIVMETKLLSYELVEANKELAQLFSIILGSKLHKIKRLTTFQGDPLDLEIIFIPSYILPTIFSTELTVDSFINILENNYSERIAVKKREFNIELATKEIVNYLNLPINSYVIKITSSVLNTSSNIILYSITYSNFDRCTFCCDLK